MGIHKQKPARGQGNQGDWHSPRTACNVSKEHQEHNARIDAEKAAKKARKKHGN